MWYRGTVRLDHGTWTIVRHMYPEADIPVLQLSIDQYKGPKYHFELARELTDLRRKGVLIIGSGNIIPTHEHYIPLLYTLGLQKRNEEISFFNDKVVGGSLTMTSVKIG